MLGRFYELIAAQLQALTNDAGERPFAREPQLVYYEAVDERAVARRGWPIVVISFKRAPITTAAALDHYADTRSRSVADGDTTNAGTSELTLSDAYAGNADWRLEATSGGTVGEPGITVRVTRTPFSPADSTSGTPIIYDVALADDGALVLADGTRATFGAGTVVAGDAWTWSSRNYRAYFERQRRAVNNVDVEFYLVEDLKDIVGVGGWLDKFYGVFLEERLCADEQFFDQDLKDVELEPLKEEGGALAAFKYTFKLELSGLVWRERREPLLGPNLKWMGLNVEGT